MRSGCWFPRGHGCDPKTVRRYGDAAEAVGLVRDDGAEQMTDELDELMGAVVGVRRR